MGQVLHGSARTTAAGRRTIQHRQERLQTRVERYASKPQTGAQWKRRASVHDAPMGEGAAFPGADASTGSAGRRVSQAYPAAPG